MTPIERCEHEQRLCESETPSLGAKTGWMDWELEKRLILTIQHTPECPNLEQGHGQGQFLDPSAWCNTPEIAVGPQCVKITQPEVEP